MAAATDDLTDRQRDVLALHREGKNPTEIGKQVGISSQAVHGHFKRLREKGLITEPAGPPRGAAARKPANGGQLNANAAIEAVRQAGLAQIETIRERQRAIEQEIIALNAEASELDDALQAIAAMVSPGESSP